MSGYYKLNEDTKIRYPGQLFMSVKKDDVLKVLRVEGDNAIVKNEGNDDEGTLSIKYLGEKVGDMYYFNENGGTEPNWYEVGDESYGKQVKSLGSMYKNEITPNGKEVGTDGRLIEEETDSNFGKYYDAVDIKNEIMAIDITEEKKKFLFFNIGSKYDVNIYLSESAMKKCIDKGNKFPKDIMYLRSIPLDSPDNVLSRDKNAIVIKNGTYKEAKNLKSKIEEDEKMLDNFYLIFGDYNKLTEDAMNNANTK